MAARGKRAPNTTLDEDLVALTKKRDAYEKSRARTATLERQFRQAEARAYERFENELVAGKKQGSRTIGDIKYVPAETMYSSVNDRTAFVEWAEEHAPHLLKSTADKGLLTEEIRRCLDDGEPPPPGSSFYIKQYISHRAA